MAQNRRPRFHTDLKDAYSDEDSDETQDVTPVQQPVILEKNQESGLNARAGDRVDPSSLAKPALTTLDGQAAPDRYQPAGSYVPPGGTPAPEKRPREFVAVTQPGQRPLSQREQSAALNAGLLEERRRKIEEKRAAIAQQKQSNDEHNSAALAKYKGSGQQYYTDPATDRIVPVLEPGTNRPLYNKSGWTPGTDPKTGKPALEMRDQYGQRQYKAAPMTHSPDPLDTNLYTTDATGVSVPVMTADEAIANPDMRIKTQGYMVARRAIVAQHRNAIAPMKLAAEQATEQLDYAKTTSSELDAQIQGLSEQAMNSDPIMAEGLASRISQLQFEKDAVDQAIKPNGAIARAASKARRALTIARHVASRDVYAQQAEAIKAISSANGQPFESNPTYQANQRMMQEVERSMTEQQEQDAREDAIFGTSQMEQPAQPAAGAAPQAEGEPQGFFGQLKEAFTGGNNAPLGDRLREVAATGNPLAMLPTSDPLSQNEPEALSARGVKNIGPKTVDQLAQEFGSGEDALKPEFVVALADRKRALDEALSPEAAAPGDLSDGLMKSMNQEREYVDALYKQRLARMDPAAREQVLEMIDKQTTTALGAAGRSAATQAGPVAAFLAGSKAGAKFMGPTAKVTRGIGPVVGGLIGGTLAAIGANKAQQKALEKFAPDLAQQIALDAEQHPIAAEAGVLASNAAMMKVDPAISVRGVSALWKLAKKETITELERKNAAVFLTNSGLGAAMGVALPLVEGEEITTGSVLQSVAENLFFGDVRGSKGPNSGTNAPDSGSNPPDSGSNALNPEQQAAEAEFQRRLAEDDAPQELTGREALLAAQPDPTKTPVPVTGPRKSAEESAEIFEPALTERAHTPPPNKPADESAIAFQEDAQNTRGLAVSEEGAQRLVDELAEASGRPRDEILATRTGKEIGQWADELQSEIEYNRNPLTVDPDRRSNELREQLAKADEEWEAHLTQTEAEAEYHANAGPVKAEAASRFQSDQAAARARHEDITGRRTAIEQQLTQIDRLRQSRQGGEELKGQLSTEQAESAAASRKLPTEELEARRDAIEDGLTVEDRTRQSAEGGEKLRADLATREGENPPPSPGSAGRIDPVSPGSQPMTAERAASMSSADFSAHYAAKNKAGIEGGLTDDAIAVGKAATPEQTESYRSKSEELKAQSKAAGEKGMAAMDAGDEAAAIAAWNQSAELGAHSQFFREAYETAAEVGSQRNAKTAGGTSPAPTTGTPATPAVERSSGAATDTVGSQAAQPVSENAVSSKEITASRKQVANQRRLVKELQKRVGAIAEKYPDRAGELQKRLEKEQTKLADLEARRGSGSAPKVGYSPTGEADLISDIAEYVGTIKTKGVGGESDGISAALSEGAARLLRSESGTAVDQAMAIMNDSGYKFRSTADFVEAIQSAAAARKKVGAAMKTETYGQGVEMAALGGPRGGKHRSGAPQTIEALGVGAKFKIKGEAFSVVDVEEGADGRWQYIIQDGHKFKVAEGTVIHPDYRSVKNKAPKPSTDFLPPEEAAPAPINPEAAPSEKFDLASVSDEQLKKEAQAKAARAKATEQRERIETLAAKPLTGDSSDVGQGVLLKGDEDLFSGPSAESLPAVKDAAPVSANVKPATPDSVEGAKIDKEWLAFSDKSGSLKIPRSEMPQIKSENRGAMVNFLKARGITAKAIMANPSELKPTQAEFSPAKVAKARDFSGSERPILISADGHVVDGHHQWVAALDDRTPLPVIRLGAPIDKLLAEIKEFPSATTSTGSAKPVETKRASDRIIDALLKAKIHKPGMTAAATPFSIAYDGAIDLAILGVRAGRAVNDVVRLAVDRFKAKHKAATPEELSRLEKDIRAAIANRPPEPPPGQNKSKVPESLRKVGVPAEDIDYNVRAQNDRMKEARTAIAQDPEKAERMIGDRSLPADTRVAIGGVLLEKKMTALQSAKPEDVPRLTREIQRIVESTRSGVSTESGQGVAMHNKIYENLSVGSAMEYVRDVTKKRAKKMGGKEMEDAATEAAEVFNKTNSQAERDAAIEKLKKKYTTGPVKKALDQLKRVEVAKELNQLGVLTRDDLLEVAGNALGIPGIDKAKLKNIADLANEATNAKTHAQRSRAELKLADTLEIYKGVDPLDLEASILTLNILSGPTTQMANIQGNALNLLTQLGTTAAVNPSKLGAIMKGVKDGIPIGWDQAKSIMATGRGTRDFQESTGNRQALGNVDYARDFPKLNKTVGDTLTLRARAVDKISRFMKATDAVYYYPAREAYARLVATKLLEGNFSGAELAKKVSETLHITPEAFAAARKQASGEGYEGIELGRRVSDIIEENRAGSSVGAQAVEQSEAFAAESTFNNEPVGLAGVIYRNLARTVKDADVAGVPVLKPWAMFLRVPANLFNSTTNFTPLGAVRAKFGMKGEQYRKGGTGEKQWKHFNQDERNRLYLQSVIGTTLMAGLTARILSDDEVNITAKGPADSARRQQLQQAGWNPYSIKVGNKWVSYRDTPLLVPLAIVGHVADAVRFQKAKSDMVLGSRVADALMHSPEIIFQTSMLSGLSDLMSSMSGTGGNPARVLGSIPANLIIPYNRLLQQVDQTFDSKTYENNPVVGSVPFLRRTGTPQKDVQGRDRTYNPLTRFASTEKNDPVDTVLREKNIYIPEPGKDTKIGNSVMTPEQYDKYRTLSGQRIRVRITSMIPQLRLMTQENAQKRVQQISREEREKVRPLLGPASKR